MKKTPIWLMVLVAGIILGAALDRHVNPCPETVDVWMMYDDNPLVHFGTDDDIIYFDTETTIDDLLDAIVTAYCPCEKCCGRYADGVTASGYVIEYGASFVAAPESIPFGTMLDIPGYGIAPVRDRGGAIKGNRLDVFFPTHREAMEWGWQKLQVKILK